MVKATLQYWYTLPIPKEEAYDKIYKWFEEMIRVKFKKDSNRPEYISLTHGKSMAPKMASKIYTAKFKKFIYITLYDE